MTRVHDEGSSRGFITGVREGALQNGRRVLEAAEASNPVYLLNVKMRQTM